METLVVATCICAALLLALSPALADRKLGYESVLQPGCPLSVGRTDINADPDGDTDFLMVIVNRGTVPVTEFDVELEAVSLSGASLRKESFSEDFVLPIKPARPKKVTIRGLFEREAAIYRIRFIRVKLEDGTEWAEDLVESPERTNGKRFGP